MQASPDVISFHLFLGPHVVGHYARNGQLVLEVTHSEKNDNEVATKHKQKYTDGTKENEMQVMQK